MTSKGYQTASSILTHRKRGNLLFFIVVFISMLCITPLIVMIGVAYSFGISLAIIGAIVIFVLVIRWPIAGYFVALGSTLLLEQNPLPYFGNGMNIYVFYWPNNLTGLPDRPIGFLMLAVLLAFICHRLLKREKVLGVGELFVPFLFFLLCVIWGIVHGLSTGGNTKILVDEVRSFWYLFLGYILAYNMITKKQHLRTFFWIVIICAGIKGLEGTFIYLVILGGNLTGNHEIMAHEESYFFVSLLLLVLLFSLQYKYRPQFYAALLVLPFVVIALIANQRRTDYIALLIAAIVAWAFIFAMKPHARKSLITIFLISFLLGGGYTAAFYNSKGGLGEPAHAIVSVFHPDASDASSNQYRINENADLAYTVKLNPMGLGFGKQFLEPVPLADLSTVDPVYLYIPHNTIYWVWMRLGPIGFLALWYLLGAIIARGSIIARRMRDQYLQLVAIYIIGMVIMEIIVAYADYQLSFYRNVIYVGMLAGILLKLPALDQETETKALAK
jgi:cell division protein FtsW (lipid II flippase)